MTRIFIAGFLGAIAYYIWGMLAWMAIPLHTPTISGLPDEAPIRAAMKKQGLETGVYIIPWSDDEQDWSDPNSDWTKNHLSGPLCSIYFHKEGMTPMSPIVMLKGFIIDLLAAALAACLLSAAVGGRCGTYARRVGFVMGLGIFVGLIGHVSYWNWMAFPLDYTIAFVIDVVVGWTLAGLVIAAVIRPAPVTGDES